MNNLLSSGFYRLPKDKVFWCGLLAMLTLSIVSMSMGVRDAGIRVAEGFAAQPLDDFYYNSVPVVVFSCAVFTGLFIGTEHHEGTIRNQIVVGHTHTQVYLSNYIICLFANVCFMAVLLIGGLVGIPALGTWAFGIKGAAQYAVVAVFFTAALTGIFTLLCMLSSNKAVTAVIALLLALGLVAMASLLDSALGQPEFFRTSVQTAEPIVNPMYVGGAKRVVYRFITDCLPSGQAIQMTHAEIERPLLSIVSSAVISLFTIGTGVLAFQRKDLK